MTSRLRILSVILIVSFYACEHGSTVTMPPQTADSSIGLDTVALRASVVSAEGVSSPTRYPYTNQSKGGWTITYDTIPNSEDLRLTWKKEKRIGIDTLYGRKELRGDFVPVLAAESDNNLFLKYRCGSDCEGLVVLSKRKLKTYWFQHVIDYSSTWDMVAWVDEEFDKTAGGRFKVGVADVKSLQSKYVQFSNLALGSFKAGYIDSIQFKTNGAILYANLYDQTDRDRMRLVKEKRCVTF